MTTAVTPHEEPRKANRRRQILVLFLILALAYVVYMLVSYLFTGKSVQEMLPQPLANALQAPPRYAGQITGISRPLGVAVAPNGDIYVAETLGERLVRVYNKDGNEVRTLAPAGSDKANRLPVYVAVSSNGTVFVSDSLAGAIVMYSPQGEELGLVQPPFEEGWRPVALAFDKPGNLYVADHTSGKHRIVVLDKDLKLVREFGKEGWQPGEFSFPNGIAIDQNGNVYVADSNNGRVQAFDKTGAFLWAIGRGVGKGDLGLPRGVAVDEERKLLHIADTTNGTVNIYDIGGTTPKFLSSFGSSGLNADAFRFPNSVALDGSRVLVTDRENNRLTIWRY